jgi:branched-chain amino acid transport system ATP-binding protein
MLAISDLSVRYGAVRALRSVSLDVAEGEIVALLGPNGAGKTSLLSAVGGLVASEAGTVSFERRSIDGVGPEAILRSGIAWVREGRHVFGGMTVDENLRVAALACRDRARRRELRAWVHELFPVLADLSARRAVLLSGGQQQQLAIGRALLSDPRLLLLDEPSLGLAPVVVDTVFEAIRRLQGEGVTMLLVEQNAARAVDVADRVYVLRGGQIVTSSDRDAGLDATTIATTYLGVSAS